MKLSDIESGTTVTNGGMSATLMCQQPHPHFSGFQLAVWVLEDGTVTFDALHPQQDVGQVVACDRVGAKDRFMAAGRRSRQ